MTHDAKFKMGVIKRGSGKSQLIEKYGITQSSLNNDVEYLKKWLHQQPYLPDLSHLNLDTWLENHILMSKNSLERAKNSVERYCTARELCPEFFKNRDISDTRIKRSFKNTSMAHVPGLTQDLLKVAIIRIDGDNVEEYDFEAHMKRAVMKMEYYFKEGIDFSGFHVVFDLCNMKLSHLTKINIHSLKMMPVIMKAYPVSFTKISVINYPSFIETLVAMFKPFISEKLLKRITLHKDISSLIEDCKEASMPSDYGCNGESVRELSDLWIGRFEDLREYIFECDAIKCDLSKCPKSDTFQIDYGVNGTFRKLNID